MKTHVTFNIKNNSLKMLVFSLTKPYISFLKTSKNFKIICTSVFQIKKIPYSKKNHKLNILWICLDITYLLKIKNLLLKTL